MKIQQLGTAVQPMLSPAGPRSVNGGIPGKGVVISFLHVCQISAEIMHFAPYTASPGISGRCAHKVSVKPAEGCRKEIV